MPNIDFNAYGKLHDAFDYARQLKNHPNGGGDTVVHLQNGEALVCNYSPTDVPKSLMYFSFTRTDEQKALNDATREVFKQSVIDIFGTSIDDVPKKVRSAMNLDKFDGTGRPLTARRILAVNKAIDAELKAFAKKLGFTGGAAPEIVSVVAKGSGLVGAADPAAVLKDRMNRNAKASVTNMIATLASRNLDYNNFNLDIERGMGLALGGKKVETHDPAVARDKVVQFLTGRKRDTFATVDEETRRKAAILMSMLHQGCIACFLTANSAFDPTYKEAKFQTTQLEQYGGRHYYSFDVRKDRSGNITITGRMTYDRRAQVILSNGDYYSQKVTDTNGPTVKYKGVIKLAAADLANLANADWTKCDTTETNAIEGNAHLDNRFQDAADKIPPQYRFSGTVDVTLKAHVNALYGIDTLPVR